MSNLRDRVNHLREEADRPHPEAWIPDGEKAWIGGVVTRIQMLNTKFGPCPVVTIRDDADIEKSVWLTHTVLRNEFHRLRVMPGETVFIRYEGRRHPEGGGDGYEAYTVRVDRSETPFDWGVLGPVPGDPAPPPRHTDRELAQRLAAEMPTAPVDDDIPF